MSKSAAKIPYFTFNNGQKVPSIGLGCWMGQIGGGQAVEDMVRDALRNGYRHLDTAYGYGNEQEVGKAIRESGIPRDQIFLTTKLSNEYHHKVAEAIDLSLKNLGVEYVDLYLMHWPQAVMDGQTLDEDEHPTFVETWKEMEKLLGTGKVKSIGVSNFSIQNLEILLEDAKVIPVTNQVESHPCLPWEDLKKYCEDKGIILTAYSPFGRANRLFFHDKDFVEIAKKHHASPAQVAVAWAVQRGTIPIPKSTSVDRMCENINLIHLTSDEMQTINEIHMKPGMHKSLLAYHKPDGTANGWTYEQLGWPMTTGGIVVQKA
ncbi:NADP-dependent oxidoreductase domain superfamily protein [Abortiporus biennis]